MVVIWSALKHVFLCFRLYIKPIGLFSVLELLADFRSILSFWLMRLIVVGWGFWLVLLVAFQSLNIEFLLCHFCSVYAGLSLFIWGFTPIWCWNTWDTAWWMYLDGEKRNKLDVSHCRLNFWWITCGIAVILVDLTTPWCVDPFLKVHIIQWSVRM